MDILSGLFGWALLSGLIVPLLLYIPFSVWVVWRAVRYARKNNKSAKCWGWGVALGMYLIVFWDWIPTVAIHQYYCAKDSGFWIYKTLDQWKQENPGVMEGLPAPSSSGSPTKYEPFDDGHGKRIIYLLNDRFNWIVIQQDISSLLPIVRSEQLVKDVQKNEVLARYVDFASGNSVKNTVGPPGPLKFWMRSQHCIGRDHDQDNLRSFRDNFMGEKR